MDNKRFDLTLDMSDEDFAKDLIKALGVSSEDTLVFYAPQFERVDGRVVQYTPTTPEEYEAIKLMKPENLIKIGCQVWDSKNDVTHWLYPYEWYDHIPNGTKIVTISGKITTFRKDITDNDIRYGALAFGFLSEVEI